MKIEKKQIEIGSRVRLLEDVEMFDCTYTKGHEFNVIGSSYRGWDLIDDDGNKMTECLFIHDKLELADDLESKQISGVMFTEEDVIRMMIESFSKGENWGVIYQGHFNPTFDQKADRAAKDCYEILQKYKSKKLESTKTE